MSIEMEMSGKGDSRLDFVKEQTKKAVMTFTQAIRESTDEQIQITFKAFTLNTSKDEAEKVFNIIMTMVAMELFQQVPELVKKITFFHSIESPSEEEHCLLLHCDKTRTPPTKDEIESQLQKEKGVDFSVEVVENEVCLPHPSVMSAYQRPGSE